MTGRLLKARTLLPLVGLAATACGPAPAPVGRSAMTPPECTAPPVATTSGLVCGIGVPGRGPGGRPREVHAYLGIRYATAARWERPEAYRSETPARATMPGKDCPQPLRWVDVQHQDEDCLFLNVRTPAARAD